MSLPFDPIAEARRQWAEHGWPAADAMAAVSSVMRAQQILLMSMENVLRPLELTLARYQALVLLYFSKNGSLPLGKMSARLQVHPTSLTGIIDGLVAKGLVGRVPHGNDRRVVLAEITEQGRHSVDLATERLTGEAFGRIDLTAAQLGQLFDVLAVLRHRAGDFA